MGLLISKKLVSAAVFTSAFLIVAMAFGTQSVSLVKAASEALAEPPVITILSPENKTYATNNITLSFNVSIGRRNYAYDKDFYELVNIDQVYFKGDWQQNTTYVDTSNNTYADLKVIEKPCKSLNFSCNLTSIPDGKHSIIVCANEKLPVFFTLLGDSSSFLAIDFIIDDAPVVSLFSPESKMYNTSDVALKFTVDELVSKVAYSLDGHENVSLVAMWDKQLNKTIHEKVELLKLANGEHNVTVYAWDEAGNIGASETVTFSIDIPEPFPTATIVASAAVTAIIIISLTVYYLTKAKRRNQENPRITGNTS